MKGMHGWTEFAHMQGGKLWPSGCMWIESGARTPNVKNELKCG